MHWQFWIDVGGTFTDCMARRPDGTIVRRKLLSSGVTKGGIGTGSSANQIVDSGRQGDPPQIWIGYEIRLLDRTGGELETRQVAEFDADAGCLTLDEPLSIDLTQAASYELFSGEGSPVVAIRYLLGLRLDQPVPQVSVRLGTTRGTNALITRRGAKTALVTTRGFADILKIGYQHRPHLFALDIVKPQRLADVVVEIDERTAADGTVLVAPDGGTFSDVDW